MRILHYDWSIRLGENRSDQTLTHLSAMLYCFTWELFSRMEFLGVTDDIDSFYTSLFCFQCNFATTTSIQQYYTTLKNDTIGSNVISMSYPVAITYKGTFTLRANWHLSKSLPL